MADASRSSPAGSLAAERYLSLATYRRDGGEVRTPVWFAAEGGRLYVFTAGDSGKVKRLRRSPRARVAPCGAKGGLRAPWQEARARLIDDPAAIARAHAALRAKYGWQMWLADALARLGRRLDRRAWIEIEILPLPAPAPAAAPRR
jgi:PPOX class probable F420-dependent enzyme